MGLLAEEELQPGMSPVESGSTESTLSLSLPIPPPFAPSGLSENEMRVLEALSAQHRLTVGQLMGRTGLSGEDLRVALGGLHVKGFVLRLHTVVESFCCPPSVPERDFRDPKSLPSGPPLTKTNSDKQR